MSKKSRQCPGRLSRFSCAASTSPRLPAVGSMNEDGSVEVVPAGHARTVASDWLSAVRYAMIDEPQCVLYNSASLPALPFQLPVPWERPA